MSYISKEELESMYPFEENEIFNNKIPVNKLKDISKALLELYELKEEEYKEKRKKFLENAISNS